MIKRQPFYFSHLFVLQAITVLIAVVMCIFASWYLLLEQPKAIQKHTVITSYVKDTIPADSINRVVLLTQYFNTTDSLKQEVDKLDQNYHDNIDLIINKSNGWTAFWITMITVFMGLLAFWQGFRIIKYEEKYYELKNNIDDYQQKTRENNELRIDQSLDKVDVKYGELDAKNKDLMCSIHENRINSAMVCINVTDPVGALCSSSRNDQFKYLLRVISNSYCDYLDVIYKNPDKEYYLALVLMNIKLAISRSRAAFTSFDQNVLFKIVDNNLEQALASVKTNKLDDKTKALLNKVNEGLKELVDNIEL